MFSLVNGHTDTNEVDSDLWWSELKQAICNGDEDASADIARKLARTHRPSPPGT
jgi:hypothetical protein